MNPYSYRLHFFTFFVLLFLFTACYSPAPAPNITPAQLVSEAELDTLFKQLTLEEKITLIHASSSFTSGGIERLGIPELIMSDGPHGVRHEHGRAWSKIPHVRDSSTYLPVGTALAATWNTELGYAFGSILGSEANYRGKDVILGPGLNIIRTPINGRNFEYLTEDPYLNAQMVIGYIQGVQDQGVAACAKHYIANNLEYEREFVNIEMSERALHEIYLPGFKAAVQNGKVWSIMAAYNKFRNDYCAESEYLLDTILKKDFGFDGAVISDWNAVKSTKEGATAGVDIEMGTDLSMLSQGKRLNYDNFFLADPLLKLVKAGDIDEAYIDAKVKSILRLMYRVNKFGERQAGAYNTKEHQQTARKVAEEAIVLLKNDNLLPLQQTNIKRLAVVGANANRKHAGAGGSSQVKAFYEVTALEGLQHLLGEASEISYSEGYTIDKKGTSNDKLIAEAVAQVKDADVAIYVGGWIHGYSDDWNDNAYDAEATDKPDMALPFGQDKLIKALLEANPNTLIVLMGGGPVDMTQWEDQAPGIIQAWYLGMEGGNALADVIFGKVNPSGKLPMTFPKKLNDSPVHPIAKTDYETLQFEYSDDIFVGYRYFDTYNIPPAYAFGHGLSYTTFTYDSLKVEHLPEGIIASLNITNSGAVSGGDVVQLYVKDETSLVDRPNKELKGFQKIFLAPNETKRLSFTLEDDAFMYYNDTLHEWVLEPGLFHILIGRASDDIRVQQSIER